MQRLRQLGEQRQAVSQRDRMHDQPVFIDKAGSSQALREAGAAMRQDVLSGLLLEPADSVARSPFTTSASAQLPELARRSNDACRVKTAFGISFMGAARGMVEVGQYLAMSEYVRRPITWRPALQSVSSTQLRPPSSRLRCIQSLSPFGPATKPSSDMDILRMSRRII